MQQYYQQPPAYMDPQTYMLMQQLMMQGMLYDPNSGMMYDPSSGVLYALVAPGYPVVGPNGVPVPVPGMVPGMPMMPPFVPGVAPGEVALNPDGTPVYPEGAPAAAPEATSESNGASASESAGASEPTAESEHTAPAAPASTTAPAAAPSTGASTSTAGKYVPPRAAEPVATTTPAPAASSTAAPASVPATAQRLSVLSIDTEPEAPVDIELPTPGAPLRYSKNTILALYNSQGTVIPEQLKEYYKPAEYTQGSVDGAGFVRAPLGSITGYAYAMTNTPGSRGGKGSSSNLRNSQSGTNLERSVSSSSFGGGNRRKGGNRDNDRDREPGEIVEGDDGFVAYEGGDEPTPRERNRRAQKAPAVYKSRFALDASDPMAIVRKANLILNKLSVTNFDKMKEEFLSLLQSEAVTEDSLQRAVEALVAKAQMEENFCFVYADLCRYVIDTWTTPEPEEANFTTASAKADQEGGDGAEAPAEEGEGASKKERELLPMGRIFKDRLISRCQTEFEFDHISALRDIRENPDLQPDERTEKEVLLKKRTTGHMRFIGELFMQDLISASVIKRECLERLLSSTVEEELVCLCKLFQTTGAKLEKYHMEKSRQKKYKSQNMQDVIPQYFEKIREIGNTHPSSRVRFMMKDLIDMRNNGWTARREEDKMVNLDKKGVEFAPVEVPFSGDARAFAASSDGWSVVDSAGKKKSASGGPSPVPGGALSRSGSSLQMSRSNSTSGTNLSGMDRRGAPTGPRGGPAGIAAPGGVAGGFKKDKLAPLNKPTGASRDNRLPRTNSGTARTGGDSPVPSGAADTDASETNSAAPAEAAEVSYGTDLAAIQKKVRSAMKEFYANGLLDEPTLTFQELRPSPEIIADVVKVRICFVYCVQICAVFPSTPHICYCPLVDTNGVTGLITTGHDQPGGGDFLGEELRCPVRAAGRPARPHCDRPARPAPGPRRREGGGVPVPEQLRRRAHRRAQSGT
jgi:translation initiation factor 4G